LAALTNCDGKFKGFINSPNETIEIKPLNHQQRQLVKALNLQNEEEEETLYFAEKVQKLPNFDDEEGLFEVEEQNFEAFGDFLAGFPLDYQELGLIGEPNREFTVELGIFLDQFALENLRKIYQNDEV